SCAALLLLMCACGGMGPDRAPATVSTGSPLLTIGLAEDLESVHPLLATSATSRQIHDLLFRRLLREEADLRQGPPRFFPDLALSWAWRDPGRHLDLWLDPTARWSDGRPLTAEDVVWTWRQQIDPDLAWPYAHAKD